MTKNCFYSRLVCAWDAVNARMRVPPLGAERSALVSAQVNTLTTQSPPRPWMTAWISERTCPFLLGGKLDGRFF
jgi:hypothetical protein